MKTPRYSFILNGPTLGILTVMMLLAPAAMRAAEDVIVELTPPRNTDAWVGERMDFAVEVGINGRFSGATAFDLPKLEGAIILSPGGSPVVSSRTIEGVEYFFQRHDFSLFTQRAGRFEIPTFTVRCESISTIGGEPVAHTEDVESFKVSTQAPPGTRPQELVITTNDLVATEKWDPVPAKTKAGDAFRRTIAVNAGNFPSMFLPDIPSAAIPEVAIYPSAPALRDATQRGEFTGSRTNEVTYVLESEGQVTLPAIEIRWWSPRRESWETKNFPAIDLEVAPNPAFSKNSEQAETPADTTTTNPWFLPIALLFLAGGAASAVWHYLRRPIPAEELAYRKLVAACKTNDAPAAYHAYHLWLSFGNSPAQPMEIQPALEKLQLALVETNASWDGQNLLQLIKLQKHRHTQGIADETNNLPKLNPLRTIR